MNLFKLKNTLGKETLVMMFIAILFLIEAYYTMQSGYFGGLDNKVKIATETLEEEEHKTIILGKITDRNGDTICDLSEVDFSVDNFGDFSGDEEEISDEDRKINNEMYFNILGYIHATKESSSELFMKYYDVLFNTPSEEDNTGNNIQLTLDRSLQKETYKVVKELVKDDTEESRASAVIMNAGTGEILAMVDFPTYDASKPFSEEEFAKFKSPFSHSYADPPGSTFKVLTAMMLLENGYEDKTIKNTPYKPEDFREYVQGEDNPNDFIFNANDDLKDDNINYKQALQTSSNIFFSRAVLEIQKDNEDILENFTNLVRRFHIGEDYAWDLDFGTVTSKWALDDTKKEFDTKVSDKRKIADTAYGQNATAFTTINNAVVAASVINNGEVKTPYMIKSITNFRDEEVDFEQIKEKEMAKKETEEEKEAEAKKFDEIIACLNTHNQSSTPVKPEIATEIKGALLDAAKTNYGFDGIGAKTGTASKNDKAEGNTNWMISFSEINEHKYVVVINKTSCGAKTAGSMFPQYIKDLYDIIKEWDSSQIKNNNSQ